MLQCLLMTEANMSVPLTLGEGGSAHDEYLTTYNHYMQTPVWASAKRHAGFRIKEVRLEHPTYGKIKLFLFIRRVQGVGKVAYAPMWPDIFSNDDGTMVTRLQEIAASLGVFVVRIEPAVAKEDLNMERIKKLGYLPRNRHVQYLSTLIADTGQPLEEVFARCNSTARNEIRKADKSGVVCEKIAITDDSLNLFANVIATTQKRQKFWLRNDEFLQDYWQLFNLTGQASLYVAKYNLDILAMAFIVKNGEKAFYKDGGSIYNKATQSLAAPTALQWYVMQDLHQQGVKQYDLCGALASGEPTPADPLWGVYKFKAKFTDNLVIYPGFIDLVVNDERYTIWKRSEKAVTRVHRMLTNDVWY